MKPNLTTTALTAIVCLLGGRLEASAQQSLQSTPATQANPESRTALNTPVLTPISQSRQVSAFVSCFDGSGGVQDIEAPDFRTFDAFAQAFGSCGFASADQHSEILENGIVASGSASAFSIAADGFAQSLSFLEVRFSVATPVAYRATGFLFQQLPGGVVVELSSNSGSHFRVETFGTIDEFGLLAPGEYVLSIGAGAIDSQADFDLSFDVVRSDRAPTPLPDPPPGRGVHR